MCRSADGSQILLCGGPLDFIWYMLLCLHTYNVFRVTIAIHIFDDGERFTPSPSPDEYYTCNHELIDEECTVLAVHWLVKKAALPVSTFILAALILRQLKSNFYDDWCETLPVYPPHY